MTRTTLAQPAPFPVRRLPTHLSQAERLALFAAMVRCRQARQAVAAERRRRRMPALGGGGARGWEAVEAAAGIALGKRDAYAASAEWVGPLTDARRVGGACHLTEMVSAGLGATIGCPRKSLVVVFAGPVWGTAETAALATAAKRRAPLVVLYAAAESAHPHTRAAALSAEAVFESEDSGDVEACALVVASACDAARAGQGPTVVAFRPGTDPIAEHARRLSMLGVGGARLRSAVLHTPRPE